MSVTHVCVAHKTRHNPGAGGLHMYSKRWLPLKSFEEIAFKKSAATVAET